MNNTINLLPNKKGGQGTDEKLAKRLRIFATLALSIVILLSVGLYLAIQFNIGLPAKSTTTSTLLQNPKAVKLLLVKDRLKNISMVLSQRNQYNTVLGAIVDNAPADVSFDSVNIDQNTLDITTSSASLESLGTLLDQLTELVDKKQLLKSYSLTSIGVTEGQSTYSMTLKAIIL